MSFESRQLYRFKEFSLDVVEAALSRNGEQISITPKAFQLLRILVENHGVTVKKDRLISEIWADSFVEEGNLAFTARMVRKVLGDDAKHPIFIETIPRKGYRFIANVSENAEDSVVDQTASAHERRSLSRAIKLSVVVVLFIATLATAGWFLSNRSFVSTVTAPILSVPFNAERLTSSGNASQAVISPSGKLVAYLDQANGKWSIWLKQLSTAENIQILPPIDAAYSGLVFSRDGNSLFFARGDGERKELNIYRINTFGGIPIRLAEKTQGWLSVSPDDRQISFVRCDYSRADRCSLLVADAAGGGEKTIFTSAERTRIADNQFSPDGRRIAFAAGQSRTGSNEFGLFQVDLDSGEVNEIASRRFFNIKSLEWLPDGSGVLMTARDINAHKFSVWSISAGSGEAIQLTNDDGNFSGLSLDAGGASLVATKVDNGFAIYHESAEEPSSRKLIAAGADIALAPDGTIVYGSADRDIWKVDQDGNNKRQLTNSMSADIAPLVSADGRYIYFTSNRSGTSHIWRMNFDGSGQKQITRDVGGYARHVSHNGEWLYYRTCLTNAFRKVRTEGGEERDAPELGAEADAFSPDGRSVAFLTKDPAVSGPSIGIRDLGMGNAARIVKLNEQHSEPAQLQWSADGQSLFFVTRTNSSYSLWRFPLTGTAAEFAADLGSDPIDEIILDGGGLSAVSVRGKWAHDAFLIRGLGR